MISLLAVGGASIILSEQQQAGSSYLYWEAIDVIIISLVSVLSTMAVVMRKPEDYEGFVDEQEMVI